jgi:hypothetical protein
VESHDSVVTESVDVAIVVLKMNELAAPAEEKIESSYGANPEVPLSIKEQSAHTRER